MTGPEKTRKRIFMLGATGTIGRATLTALVARGYEVICFVRAGTEETARPIGGAELRFGDVTDPHSLARQGFRGEPFDVVVSCMASRSGLPVDAWAIDYDAHIKALAAAQWAGVGHVVLLSAICVQKPRLAFQHAKRAFEKALVESGLAYSIVRPTAYFRSLSGQVERVRNGKPFLVFGNGELTACKPISDDDLAHFLADCVGNPELHHGILPIGGPGEAITPKQQGEMLFALFGKKPRFRRVPLRLLDIIIGALDVAGRISAAAARKAELARIGRYYASESMLVLDPQTSEYNAAATPSTGTETLADHYRALIEGKITAQRGEHSVF